VDTGVFFVLVFTFLYIFLVMCARLS